MPYYKLSLLACSLITSVLVGCQSTTLIQSAPVEPQGKIEPETPTSGVRITPYPDSGIIRETKPLPPRPSISTPPRIILPTTQSNTTMAKQLKDGRGIAAYERLMQNHLRAVGQNNWVEAEKNLLQAQRIAPQSADVYRELARLANLRKQGANAEAFARKGLTFAQNNLQRKQLWQQILQSGQIRNNALLIQQAQKNIAQY